jgi:hypothetical protein
MSKDESPDIQPGVQWTPQIDKMLADWCDEAKCFEWMNTEAYSRYSKLSIGMSITTNTVISLSGIANLIVGNLTSGTATPIIFGCISIGIGIINMVQEKFDWSTMAGNFKSCAMLWSNITRKLEEQLIIPPGTRKDCATFLKYINQDIATASEHNSAIPKDIRDKCFTKFSKIPDFNVPDICGQLEHTVVYVEPLHAPLLTQ